MSTRFILFTLTLVSLFTVGFAMRALAADKTAEKDCCAQKLACCSKTSACCSTDAKLGCCAKGMKCCADNSGCCAAAQSCCTKGEACCDEGKACCGAKGGAKSSAVKPVDANVIAASTEAKVPDCCKNDSAGCCKVAAAK